MLAIALPSLTARRCLCHYGCGVRSSRYEPFEFHESQPRAASEVVVQFFKVVAIPCTQKRSCPRCRFQAKGSFRSSTDTTPNSGEHSERVIATPRNVHTRKVRVCVWCGYW